MGRMQTIEEQLLPGVAVPFISPGVKVAIMDASAPVRVQFFDASRQVFGEMDKAEAGDVGGPGGEFYGVYLSSDTAQTVRVIVTGGEMSVSRVAGSVRIVSPDALDDAADVTPAAGVQTEILPSVVGAALARVALDAGASGPVRVGGAGVGIAAGFPLYPGKVLEQEFSGPVFVYVPAGTTGQKIYASRYRHS